MISLLAALLSATYAVHAAFSCAHTRDGVFSFLTLIFLCGSKMKRMDKSDNEEEREPENQKKKRKRIKQLESDSSDEEGKRCKNKQPCGARGLAPAVLLSKAVGSTIEGLRED